MQAAGCCVTCASLWAVMYQGGRWTGNGSRFVSGTIIETREHTLFGGRDKGMDCQSGFLCLMYAPASRGKRLQQIGRERQTEREREKVRSKQSQSKEAEKEERVERGREEESGGERERGGERRGWEGGQAPCPSGGKRRCGWRRGSRAPRCPRASSCPAAAKRHAKRHREEPW
eukprot:2013232-Rhodomonas_salina.4